MSITDDRKAWRKASAIEREVETFWSAFTTARVAALILDEPPLKEPVLRIMRANGCKAIDMEQAEKHLAHIAKGVFADDANVEFRAASEAVKKLREQGMMSLARIVEYTGYSTKRVRQLLAFEE